MKKSNIITRRGQLAIWSLLILQFALFLAACKTTHKHSDPNMQPTKYGVPSSYIDTIKN
jgi:hypothetical protein